MIRAIHIHEDDWGVRNLYPIAAFPEATADVARAIAAGERNRLPGGIGWSDIHIIQAPTVDYSSLGLKLTEAVDALQSKMPRVRRFTATAMAGFDPNVRDPYGSYEESAYCFALDRTCFVKLEPAKDLVKDIWFECQTQNPTMLAELRRSLQAIDRLAPSVIADYQLDLVGPVRDEAFLERYFKSLTGDGE